MADLRINGWSNESLKCQQDLDLKRELLALLKFVFLVSRGGCVALPRGAMGLSSVCDCGIF